MSDQPAADHGLTILDHLGELRVLARKLEILKAHPGETVDWSPPQEEGSVYPILRCTQEIPCNPCSTVCSKHSIEMEGDPILGRPASFSPMGPNWNGTRWSWPRTTRGTRSATSA